MIRYRNRQRSLNALLIAGIVHMCFAISLTIYYYRHTIIQMDDVVGVELIDVKTLERQQRTLKRQPKKLNTTKQTKELSEISPRNISLTAAANPIDETVRPTEEVLLNSATETVSETLTNLPDVTTHAEQLNSSTTAIPKAVASPFEITSGAGEKSLRQRVKGDGDSGFHRFNSTGSAEIGGIGDGIGQGTGGGSGKGKGTVSIDSTNPFAEALKKIADHIIGTRTVDKVNIVFVLDTSASMRDNIQQVAKNLYSMTDEFDLINLEYHIGMTEFSVRRDGQEINTRSLVPDVGILKRRMEKTELSGDENALDALMETLTFIDFHPDADKFLILVTDEPATSIQKNEPLDSIREKVIDQCKLQDIRVNILGFPEPFQEKLSQFTGGLWQEIPGGTSNPGSLPTNRVGNQELLKIFRDIATDIRRNGGKQLFSLDLKFDLEIEGDDIPLKQISDAFRKNGVNLKNHTFRSYHADIIEKQKNDMWVITDYDIGQVFTIRRFGNKLYVYGGITPDNWGFEINATANTQQRGKRWTIKNQSNNQIYTLKQEEDRLNVYTGGQPGTASNNASEPIVDIVIMLDYSRSMGGKSQALMLGISTLIGRLSILPIQYRIGLIRFAEAKDAIKVINGAVLAQMPINEVIIESLMKDPFGGDEHLTDAIVEGLPKMKFSPYARRFILVLTDEPTTGKHSIEQALDTCKSLGITAYVVGHPKENDFQSILTQETGGQFYTMPKYTPKSYPNQ
ncbi:VWA domain-containing protein [Candidatus Poribacteria bacterium]|nr:VWA domain-containing protein [Candidatus Poribacteria bacterium]